MKKRWIGLAGLVVVILVVGGAMLIMKGEEPEKELPRVVPETVPAVGQTKTEQEVSEDNAGETDSSVIRVSAKELSAEFNENPVALEMKYKDKTLEITGIVDRIWTGRTVGPYLMMDNVAFRHIPKEELATLKSGDKVTVRGTLYWGVAATSMFLTVDNASLVD